MLVHQLIDVFSAANPDVDFEVIEDKEFPFPAYELEIEWTEWKWNDARTDRLDETIDEGTTINPVDFADENGDINFRLVGSAVAQTLIRIVENPDRVGAITIKG